MDGVRGVEGEGGVEEEGSGIMRAVGREIGTGITSGPAVNLAGASSTIRITRLSQASNSSGEAITTTMMVARHYRVARHRGRKIRSFARRGVQTGVEEGASGSRNGAPKAVEDDFTVFDSTACGATWASMVW